MPKALNSVATGLVGMALGCQPAQAPTQTDIPALQDSQIATAGHLAERIDRAKRDIGRTILGEDSEADRTQCDTQQQKAIIDSCEQSPYIQQAHAVEGKIAKKLQSKLKPSQLQACTDKDVLDEDCLGATSYRAYPKDHAIRMQAKIEGAGAMLECLADASAALRESLKQHPIDRTEAKTTRERDKQAQKDFQTSHGQWEETREKRAAGNKLWAKQQNAYTYQLEAWNRQKADIDTFPLRKRAWLGRKAEWQRLEQEYFREYGNWKKEKDQYEKSVEDHRQRLRMEAHATGGRPLHIVAEKFRDPPSPPPLFNEPEPENPGKLPPKPVLQSPPELIDLPPEPLAPIPSNPVTCKDEGRFKGKPYTMQPLVESLTYAKPYVVHSPINHSRTADLPEYVPHNESLDPILAQVLLGEKRVSNLVQTLGESSPRVETCRSNYAVAEAANNLSQRWESVLAPLQKGHLETCHSTLDSSLNVSCIEKMASSRKTPGFVGLLRAREHYQQVVMDCLGAK